MKSPVGRSKLPIIGAVFLVLVAVAVFLTLDLGGGSVTSSDLPVVRLGQVAEVGEEDQSVTTGSVSGVPGSTATTKTGGVSPNTTTTGAVPPGTTAGGSTSANTTLSTGVTAGPAESATTTTTTTTTIRETVTGGVRVQNGQGATQGAGGASSSPGSTGAGSPAGSDGGSPPGTSGGRR